jgi:hypothetical protein
MACQLPAWFYYFRNGESFEEKQHHRYEKSVLIVFLLNFIFTTAPTQDTSALRRTPHLLTLSIEGKPVYEEQIKDIPYLNPNGSIQMYFGETVYLKVELKNSAIVKMKAVREISNPPSTLTLQFSQVWYTKGSHVSMFLYIDNPFLLVFTCESKIFAFKSKSWFDSDVISMSEEG